MRRRRPSPSRNDDNQSDEESHNGKRRKTSGFYGMFERLYVRCKTTIFRELKKRKLLDAFFSLPCPQDSTYGGPPPQQCIEIDAHMAPVPHEGGGENASLFNPTEDTPANDDIERQKKRPRHTYWGFSAGLLERVDGDYPSDRQDGFSTDCDASDEEQVCSAEEPDVQEPGPSNRPRPRQRFVPSQSVFWERSARQFRSHASQPYLTERFFSLPRPNQGESSTPISNQIRDLLLRRRLGAKERNVSPATEMESVVSGTAVLEEAPAVIEDPVVPLDVPPVVGGVMPGVMDVQVPPVVDDGDWSDEMEVVMDVPGLNSQVHPSHPISPQAGAFQFNMGGAFPVEPVPYPPVVVSTVAQGVPPPNEPLMAPDGLQTEVPPAATAARAAPPAARPAAPAAPAFTMGRYTENENQGRGRSRGRGRRSRRRGHR